MGLVSLEEGKKYKNEPSKTRLFPTDELVIQIWEYFLDIEQEIKPPYITIKDPAKGWHRIINRLVKDHPERQGMTTINEFLKNHTWACKGPVQLKYLSLIHI